MTTRFNTKHSLLSTTVALLASAAIASAGKEFTVKSGALVEAIYYNTDSKTFSSTIVPELKRATGGAGGEHLANFEVLKTAKGDRAISHIALVQWMSPDARVKASRSTALSGRAVTDSGFYALQADLPVKLSSDRIYDFTSAWTIAKEPAQMPVIKQVLDTYFGKIGPALMKYGISQTAFFGPHPASPDSGRLYRPQMFGIFEWRKLEDYAKFNADPMYTEHVDIRDAIMEKMDTLLTRVI